MYNVHVYVCIIRTHTEILTPTHTHTQNIVKTMYIQLLTSLSLMGNQVCQRRVRLLDHCVSDNRDRPCDPSLQRSSLKTGLSRTKTWFFSFFFMNSPRKTATIWWTVFSVTTQSHHVIRVSSLNPDTGWRYVTSEFNPPIDVTLQEEVDDLMMISSCLFGSNR